MIELRPCRDDTDKEASIAVYNEVWPHEAVDLEAVRAWERRASATVDLVASVDGHVAGSGAGAVMHNFPNLATLLVTVLPAHRRRGIGTALFAALSRWAAQQGVAEAETRTTDADPPSIVFAERRGFRVHGHEPGLALDLADVAPPPVAPPPGIRIAGYEDEHSRGIYDVGLESDPDVPGSEDYEPEPIELWLAAWQPDDTVVALAADEVVGYAKLRRDSIRPTEASHMMTAVKRAWRGRGVAGALKRAQIAWAKEVGVERLKTCNDSRNEPIRRLNLGLGYRPSPGRVWLRGPLAS